MNLVSSLRPSSMFGGKRNATRQRRRRPSLSAAIAIAAFAAIISTPCFGMETSQPPATDGEEPPSPLLRGDSSSPEVEEITLVYDISNDCGLDADAIMNEENNTLKEGLIAATTSITIGVLDDTFGGGGKAPTATDAGAIHQKGNILAPYYADVHPVVIDRILNIEANCPAGQNCQLVLSTVPVVLDPEGDVDVDAVKEAVVGGMQDSFQDGSFFGAIPADTVICPENGMAVSSGLFRRTR